VVEPAEVATLSEQLIGPFVVLVEASLGEQLGDVDLSATEPHIVAQVASARARSSLDYTCAAKDIELLSRELMAPWGRDFDVLVTPTMGVSPPRAGTVMEATHANAAQPAEIVVGMAAFTLFANVTGQPAISLPVHHTEDGVPIGAQLVGRPFDETTLLRLAAAIEQALPWTERQPPLSQLGGQYRPSPDTH
jgi:amidase